MKKLICLIVLMLSLTLFGCSNQNEVDDKKGNQDEQEEKVDPDTLKLVERERVITENKVELLRDLNFSRGFFVTKFHANTSGGVPLGYLTYNDLKADGDNIWTFAQWGCQNNILDGTYTRKDGIISYDDGSKLIKFDINKTGCVTLEIKGSVEYPLDENGNYGERETASQNWPHILISQDFDSYATLSGVSKLMFEIDYKVNSVERLTTHTLDTSMHAAQFQWFVTLCNKNPESESYNQSMWFGFSMYDTRYDGATPPGICQIDGGKEDSTGVLIYMFSLGQAASVKTNTVSIPSAEVGVEKSVKLDAIPFVKAALKAAQKQGAMKGATIDDLILGGTNIGWELPGSYDVSVDISYMNIYIEK